METTQLRSRAQTCVAQLSSEKLKVALDFLEYLVYREEEDADEATRELLDIPNFEEELAAAKERVDAGEVVDWRSVKRDV